MEKTIGNLAKAFVGESMARNRYTFYSKAAKNEGYEQLADIFLMTADNEREHAEWFFKLLIELRRKAGQTGDMTLEAEVPAVLGATAENLKAAIAGEHMENSKLYPGFADTAEKEGLADIASRIRAIAVAEKHHEERYAKLLREVEGRTVFRKKKKVYWVCRKCGYVHFGEEPPDNCPSCSHKRNFFELKNEEY
jgi:rubrerythrin